MKIDVKRCRQIQQKGRAKETEGQMKADRRQTLRDRQIHRSTGNTKATCLFTFNYCLLGCNPGSPVRSPLLWPFGLISASINGLPTPQLTKRPLP